MTADDRNQTLPPPASDGAAAAAPRVASGHPAPGGAPSSIHPEPDRSRQSLSRWLGAGLVLGVIVIVALAAALRHQQQQMDTFGREAVRRIDESSALAEQTARDAREVQTQSQGLVERLGTLEDLVQKSQDQQNALELLYRELVTGNDEAVLVDVEQNLLMATEQLRLAGNVPNAITALQLADARLARANRPAFASARRAIAQDLARLQALPLLDVAQTSTRIEQLIAALDTLPLMAAGMSQAPVNSSNMLPAEPVPQAATPEAEAAAGPWWDRAWGQTTAWADEVRDALLADARNLVRIQRIDRPDAMLVSPEQGAALRANLKLRLLDARMALLARQNSIWDADLKAVAEGLEHYFDRASPLTVRAISSVAALRELQPAPEYPDISPSLNVVRALLARSGHGAEHAAGLGD